jgi:hypothetical protein
MALGMTIYFGYGRNTANFSSDHFWKSLGLICF